MNRLVQQFDTKRQTRLLYLGYYCFALLAFYFAIGVRTIALGVTRFVCFFYRRSYYYYHSFKRPVLPTIELVRRALLRIGSSRTYEKRYDLLLVPTLPSNLVPILV